MATKMTRERRSHQSLAPCFNESRGSRHEEAHFNFGFWIPGVRSRGRSGSDFGLFTQSLVTSAVTAALILLLAGSAYAQDSQFYFDGNGNLLAQATEISAPPRILAQPQPQLAAPGGLASFLVVAADTRGLSYQWRFNDTDLPGATGDALLLTNVGATN